MRGEREIARIRLLLWLARCVRAWCLKLTSSMVTGVELSHSWVLLICNFTCHILTTACLRILEQASR